MYSDDYFLHSIFDEPWAAWRRRISSTMVVVGTAAHLRLHQPAEHTCGRFGKVCGARTGLHTAVVHRLLHGAFRRYTRPGPKKPFSLKLASTHLSVSKLASKGGKRILLARATTWSCFRVAFASRPVAWGGIETEDAPPRTFSCVCVYGGDGQHNSTSTIVTVEVNVNHTPPTTAPNPGRPSCNHCANQC